MAQDKKRRQQRQAQKKARRDKRERARRPAEVERIGGVRVAAILKAPLAGCLWRSPLENQGMTVVILRRELPGGDVAFASFMLDLYCLGVKDAFARVLPALTLEKHLAGNPYGGPLEPVAPAAARAVVDGAVDYAGQFGFHPPRGFENAYRLFGDIPAGEIPDGVVFGRGGKPLNLQGPNDSPSRARQILRQLESHCGRDGYHFAILEQPGEDLDDWDEPYDDADYGDEDEAAWEVDDDRQALNPPGDSSGPSPGR